MKNSKTKVVMVTNYYFPTIGGISTYVESLVTGLNKINHDTEIICYPLLFRNWESKIRSKFLRKLLRSELLLLFILNSELKILRNRFSYRKVIVHSHSASFCLMIGVLSRAFGCKAIHTYHSPIDQTFKHLGKLSKKVNAIIFVSEETQKLYQSRCNIENEVIEIIPGVIDQNKFYPKKSDEIAKIKKELAGLIGSKHISDRIVLFVGRVTEEKGIMPLVKSIKIVKKSIPNIFLVIIGPHSIAASGKKFFEEVQTYISKNKLDDIVLFTGKCSEENLLKLYSACDIFTCPSVWEEPSGIVPIEAMASGKPVIATKVGGLQYRIVDDKTGYLVEKNNAEELAEKIITLLKNKKLLKKMSVNARLHVERNYSQEAMIESHRKVYDMILKR